MAVLGGITALCLYQMLLGANGLIHLPALKAERAALSADAQAMAAERARMKHRVMLMGEEADPDYAEELVRQRLRLVREDEIIVRLPK
jgi:cell division protein FtsB